MRSLSWGVLIAAGLSLTAQAQKVEPGSFNILTYNIAGLPEIISKKKPRETIPEISKRLSPYSIVHVQEDFNYNDLTYASAPHPHKTKTSGPVPVGSGLNTLSNFPFLDLTRERWDRCWFNEGDCLTPKGFTAMRVSVAKGVVIDFYNLHGEAGDDDLDFATRTAGYKQLIAFIADYSAGNAVVLAGDTNTRYTSAQDPIRLLSERTPGLTDVWLELEKNGKPPAPGPRIECPFPVAAGREDNKCEQIDKIFYRSSAALKLVPKSYRNDNAGFLKSDGGPLSDHFPMAVGFEFRPQEKVWGTASVGGSGGGYFTDLKDHKSGVFVTEVSLRGGSRLDAISYKFSDGRTVKRGGAGGSERGTVKVSGGVKEVEICEGQMNGGWGVHYIRVENKGGEKVEAGRIQGNMKCTKFNGEGDGLVGFWGRSGKEVDQLAILWGKK